MPSTALLFYDHFVTLKEEIQYIWRRKFNAATYLFFLTRYIALFERITLMVSLFLVTTDDKVSYYRSFSVLHLRECLITPPFRGSYPRITSCAGRVLLRR